MLAVNSSVLAFDAVQIVSQTASKCLCIGSHSITGSWPFRVSHTTETKKYTFESRVSHLKKLHYSPGHGTKPNVLNEINEWWVSPYTISFDAPFVKITSDYPLHNFSIERYDNHERQSKNAHVNFRKNLKILISIEHCSASHCSAWPLSFMIWKYLAIWVKAFSLSFKCDMNTVFLRLRPAVVVYKHTFSFTGSITILYIAEL